MNDDLCLYIGKLNKPPFRVMGKHPVLGTYEIRTDPEWRIINKDGEATCDGQSFSGVKVGMVGVIAKCTFPDGSSLESPEVVMPVRHIIPTEIFIAAKAKAAA